MTKSLDDEIPQNSLLGDLDSLRSTLKVVPAPVETQHLSASPKQEKKISLQPVINFSAAPSPEITSASTLPEVPSFIQADTGITDEEKTPIEPAENADIPIDDIPLLSDVVVEQPDTENLPSSSITSPSASKEHSGISSEQAQPAENLAPAEHVENNTPTTTVPGALSENIIEALLDDSWKQSYDELLGVAREQISTARIHWSRDRAEASAHAFMKKINLGLEQNISEAVNDVLIKHTDELRDRILQSLRQELKNIPEFLSHKDTNGRQHR